MVKGGECGNRCARRIKELNFVDLDVIDLLALGDLLLYKLSFGTCWQVDDSSSVFKLIKG